MNDFNELDRLEIRSRLLPYVIPAPGALLTNGVSVSKLHDPELPSHYEMVRAVHQKLRSWSPAIFIGYNSIAFDERIFRQALYQTLHPPYLTNTVGNSRTDAMKMVQAASVFAPDALVIPINEKGAPTFKLEYVAAANGFDEHNAHDALGDVEATMPPLQVALRAGAWDLDNANSVQQEATRPKSLRYEPVVCLTEFYGGPYSWLVSAIGRNPDNESEICVVDLNEAPEELSRLNDEELAAHLRKSPKPVRSVRSNSCPILMPSEQAPEIAAARQLGAQELQRRSRAFRTNKLLRERLLNAFVGEREERPRSVHVEQQIYDGFFSDEDQELLFAFHDAEWERRWEMIQQFKDDRLQKLSRRLVFSEACHCVPTEFRLACEQEYTERLLAEEAEWLTIPKAIQQTEDMLKTADAGSRSFLLEYRAYLNERLEHALRAVS